jgi:hypothetical protein
MAGVSDDARIAPSAARERRAFAAGLRPRAQWLSVAALVAGLVAVAGGTGRTELATWVGLGELAQAPAEALRGALDRLVIGTLAIAAVVVGVVVTIGIASGSVGPVSSAERRRLSIDPVRMRAVPVIVGSLVLVMFVAELLRGVVAGAARAPAASEAGLAILWSGTASRVLSSMVGLLAIAGVLELVLSRRANRRALFQTEAQARSDAQGSGGRRG